MPTERKSPLRILLVGQDEPGAIEHAWMRALSRDLSVHPQFFAVSEGETRPVNPSILYRAVRRISASAVCRAARRRLVAVLSSMHPVPDAAIVFKGASFSRQSLDACAASSPTTLWINVNPDDPTNLDSPGSTNRDIFNSLTFFDMYCTWSRSVVSRLKESGCRHVIRIPFAYDADVHRPPMGWSPELAGGISFVGTWDKEREQALASLSGLETRIFGSDWHRVSSRFPLRRSIHDEKLFGADFAREISNSLASINLLRPQNRDSHNMRTFEIPAVGGLMLTQNSSELREFLQPGRDCLVFNTPHEMRERAEQVMRYPGDFVEMRARGLQAVSSHSYDARARQLVQAIVELLHERTAGRSSRMPEHHPQPPRPERG